MTHGKWACRRPVARWSWPSAAPSPGALGAADARGRIIWLNPSITGSRASRRYPQTANVMSRRGPGQQLELTTGESTLAIGRRGHGNDLDARPGPPPGAAPGQEHGGVFGALLSLAPKPVNSPRRRHLSGCAYARDRSVPGLVRDVAVRCLGCELV
jgi:hypothetical protein